MTASTDSEVRLAEHFAGRQHMGWVQVREGLAKLKAMNDGKGPPAPPSKRGGSEAGEREREPVRERSRSRERRRSRSRERARDRSRDRYRARDRDYDRYRDTRDYRDRDRDSRDYRDRRY
jgi:hypothetical protein